MPLNDTELRYDDSNDCSLPDIESFWSMLKRGYVGIYHRFSAKHLDRYVKEYARRRRAHELDTIEQMSKLVMQFWGVRLTWATFVTGNDAT